MYTEQIDENKNKILIVDDTPENLRLLSTMLMARGYVVRAMINGPMALASVQVDPPDIILLDVNMPEMNGYEVCRRLKDDELTRNIPVIFISALDEVMSKIEAFRVGGIDYITKPFQVEEVLARVNTHLTIQQMQQYLQEQNIRLQSEIADRNKAEESLRDAVHELEKRNQEMFLLNRLGDVLQRAQTVDEAYSVCIPLLRQLFPYQNGALYIRKYDHEALQLVSVWGTNTPIEACITTDSCLALQGEPVSLVERSESPEQCQHVPTENSYPYLCVHLSLRGESFGLLHLRNGLVEFGEVAERWKRLVVMVSDRLSLALANLHLRSQLREQSIRDPLTDLFNRRYLEEILERELNRALYHHHPIGFIMLDIDHFKSYNDTYGHDGGDALLKRMGTFVRAHIRGEDIACRYGGEEFLLVLPGASLDNTHKRAQKLCMDIREMQVTHEGISLGRITISLGVASFSEHGTTAEAVIAAADQALYRAKSEGRNRVVVAQIDAA